MAGEERPQKPAGGTLERVFALIPVALSILFFYLLYRIFQPFLGAIIWALILAILFAPLHTRVRVWLKGRRSLAALAMTLLVILVVVIPVVLLSMVLGRQAAHGITVLADTLSGLQEGNGGGLLNHPSVVWVRETVLPSLNLEKTDFQGPLLAALRKLSATALGWSTAILQNLVRMIFSLFIMLFTLYYVFKDGGAASRYVQSIHPMVAQTRIIRTMQELTVTTFYAGFVTAAVQGLLAGVAFAVLAVPSAFFWGTMTALLSFVPMVGATSIWLPVVIWFLINGATGKAIGLAIWGVGVVSVADNLIKPALISGRMNLHPLLVFFSVLGGLAFFGPLGIILGPLVLVLSLSLLDAFVNASRSAGE